MQNQGTTCNEAVSLMDIHPTLLEMVGSKSDTTLQCVSLLPQLQNPNSSRYLPAIVTHEQGNNSIVWKDWNYIRYSDGSEELYNHSNDYSERNNLAKIPKFESIKTKLIKFIPEVKIKQIKNGKNKEGG